MVGQLVSLNQLDQLISINQTLSNLGGSGSTSTTGSQVGAQNASANSGAASVPQIGSQNELNAHRIGNLSNNVAPASHTPSVSQAPGLLQPGYAAAAGSNALMNLYGSFTAPAQHQ
jgi:flagellar basal-body rod modification protein FlgD